MHVYDVATGPGAARRDRRASTAAPPAAASPGTPTARGFFYTRYPRRASAPPARPRFLPAGLLPQARHARPRPTPTCSARTSRASPRRRSTRRDDGAVRARHGRERRRRRAAQYLRGPAGPWRRVAALRRPESIDGPVRVRRRALPAVAQGRAARQDPARSPPASATLASRAGRSSPRATARSTTFCVTKRRASTWPSSSAVRRAARSSTRDGKAVAHGADPARSPRCPGVAAIGGDDVLFREPELRRAVRLVPRDAPTARSREPRSCATSPVRLRRRREVVARDGTFEGRHARSRSPSCAEGRRALDGTQPDAALRLRRLRHQPARRPTPRCGASGSSRAASTRWRTCAAAASSARTGTSAGNLTKKQNVFDDFIACAQRLVERRLHEARASSRSRAAPTAAC